MVTGILAAATAAAVATISGPGARADEAPFTTIEDAIVLGADGDAVDHFGWSTAIEGDTLVVGAPYDDTAGGIDAGSVTIFVRDGDDWVEQAQLHAPDGKAGDHFGTEVGLAGNTIVVGSPQDWIESRSQMGTVHVFVRTGTDWAHQSHLLGATGSSHEFGSSVDISGDRIVVGAPSAFGGRAFVFSRSGATWSQQAELSGVIGRLGAAVAIDGDTVVAGAYQAVGGGAVVVWEHGSIGWTLQEILAPSVPDPGSRFGNALAISGDTVVVGAPADDASGVELGAVYAFARTGVSWAEQGVLANPEPEPLSGYGTKVAIGVDVAFASSPLAADGGAVVQFARTGSTWAAQSILAPSDPLSGDRFGSWIAFDGTTAAIGSELADVGGIDHGAAYVFPPDSDVDADGLGSRADNCPDFANPAQIDTDHDGIGEVCDDDLDNDGVENGADRFPIDPTEWADTDNDGIGDNADPDADGDGVLNGDDPNPWNPDVDSDGHPDGADNCPTVRNDDQGDQDGDGLGDPCDPDRDGDGVGDNADSCPTVENPDQADQDDDGLGDACDPDRDGDGIPDVSDGYPLEKDGALSGVLSRVVGSTPALKLLVTPVRGLLLGLRL